MGKKRDQGARKNWLGQTRRKHLDILRCATRLTVCVLFVRMSHAGVPAFDATPVKLCVRSQTVGRESCGPDGLGAGQR